MAHCTNVITIIFYQAANQTMPIIINLVNTDHFIGEGEANFPFCLD